MKTELIAEPVKRSGKYKQTEIGMIPEEWELKTLSQIGLFKKGRGIKKDEVQPDGIPCVRYGELYTKHNYFIERIDTFIPESIAKDSQKIQFGDILFAGSGETKEDIGKCAAFLGDYMAYAGGDIIILSPSSGMNSLFLGFILNHEMIARQKAQAGQGDAVVHIYPAGLGKVMIPVPPMKEQTAIAEALSDADAMIASLEKLIDKKKKIKQGAMQELLRPKEGWVKRKLGEVCDLFNGYAFKSETYTDSGEYSIVTIANVQAGFMTLAGSKSISKLPADISNHQILLKGDMLISMTGNVGRVCVVVFENCLLNQRVGKLANIRIEKMLLYWILQDKQFVNQMILNAQGGAQGNIGKFDILDYQVCFPDSLQEQEQIASTLNEFDFEISLIEKKLSKAISMKQGMMQNLLTGKIRLV